MATQHDATWEMTTAYQAGCFDYVIVGAGMSGLCAAAMLLKRGQKSFLILERSNDVGGTWLENHYPNAGCDVPSFLYSFSFAPKPDWSEKYARQPEILQYFREVTDKHQIRSHIAFGHAVEEACYSPHEHGWLIRTACGKSLRCRYLISAVGQLSTPSIPEIRGEESFEGTRWHSARWPAEVDLNGKRVAVIGNGASTIQFLPVVAERARSVVLYQRHPSWIHPLRNHKYPPRWHAAFRIFPWLQAWYRFWIFLICEIRIFVLWDRLVAHAIYRRWLTRSMQSRIRKELQSKLIPNYPPGCKRILLSSDFLEIVQRPHVTIETAPIERFSPSGLVTKNGEIPVDCVIYGTGFQTHPMVSTLNIINGAGVSLRDAWQHFPATYYGLATPGFPNLFFLYGPNTNLGHNSIIYMVETQVNHLLKLIELAATSNAAEIEVRDDVVREFVHRTQLKLSQSAWGAGCSSWYKAADGLIPNNWHTSTLAYRWQLRKPNPDHWKMIERK